MRLMARSLIAASIVALFVVAVSEAFAGRQSGHPSIRLPATGILVTALSFDRSSSILRVAGRAPAIKGAPGPRVDRPIVAAMRVGPPRFDWRLRLPRGACTVRFRLSGQTDVLRVPGCRTENRRLTS